MEWIKTPNEILKAPSNWKWVPQVEIDNTIFRHGDKDKKAVAKQAVFYSEQLQRPVNLLVGHHHMEIGATDIRWGPHLIWGGFTGALIDTNSTSFEYTHPYAAIGASVVVNGRLHPHLMKRDKHGRWTGEL